MLASKYINIDTIAEVPKENELRNTVSLLIKNKKYISPYSYGFTNNEIITDFFTNGNRTNIAAKGTRPNVNLKLSKTVPGQYYLIKFSDGSVRLSVNDVDYTSTPQGDIIGTAEENLKYLILELQGGGGGGSGGNAFLAGAGGASGGYIICIINVEHNSSDYWKQNSFPLKIGNGGAIRSGRGAGNPGEDTGLYINASLGLCAAGGNAANAGTAGSARTTFVSGLDDIVKSFVIENGQNGTDGGSNSIPAFSSPALAPDGNNIISRQGYGPTSSGASGSGGCSHFGAGGGGFSSVGTSGKNGEGPGAGGGGGDRKNASSTKSGAGISGLINFYY